MINLLSEVRDHQLAHWELARKNYFNLCDTLRRPVNIGAMKGALQFNPARAVSTGASTDKAVISTRPCFLCKANRPQEQLYEEILPGWEFLVNPYPIFPLHFTIAATEHIAQDSIPIEMASMAEKLPGMCVFFNGARAGASAPDHLHCQAVMKSELPLMNYLESGGDLGRLPYEVIHRLIPPTMAGMKELKEITEVKGIDRADGKPDAGLVNAYMWLDDHELLNAAVVRRSAHRPDCYVAAADSTDADGFMVSPGAVDMAGIIILPRRKDFDSITQKDIDMIISQTALKRN